MTDHPCKGMTKAQRAAFERIAINQEPRCSAVIIDKLLAAGVIERGPPKRYRDKLGSFEVSTFTVPVAVHHQWCCWCSENA